MWDNYRVCFLQLLSVSTLQWRHNGLDSVSNHHPHDCLLKRLFRPRSKKTSKLRVTGLRVGNSPETGEFPAQRASNAKIFPFDDVIMNQEYAHVWICLFELLEEEFIRNGVVIPAMWLYNGCRTGLLPWKPHIKRRSFFCKLIFPWTKWPPFRRRHFQKHFLQWKSLYFDLNFTEGCS